MGVYDALNVLGLKDIGSLNDKEVKKVYRKLMGKHHPDKGGDHEKAQLINEAYSVIKSALKKFSVINDKSNDGVVFCQFRDLGSIYGGTEINGVSSTGHIKVNRGNVRTLNTYVDINVSIIVEGVVYSFTNYVRWNIGDDYSIKCVIPSVYREFGITLNAYGKSVDLILRDKAVVNFKYSPGIKLEVVIERGYLNG